MASAFHALVDVQVSAFHGRNLSKGLFETNNPYLRVVVGDVKQRRRSITEEQQRHSGEV